MPTTVDRLGNGLHNIFRVLFTLQPSLAKGTFRIISCFVNSGSEEIISHVCAIPGFTRRCLAMRSQGKQILPMRHWWRARSAICGVNLRLRFPQTLLQKNGSESKDTFNLIESKQIFIYFLFRSNTVSLPIPVEWRPKHDYPLNFVRLRASSHCSRTCKSCFLESSLARAGPNISCKIP